MTVGRFFKSGYFRVYFVLFLWISISLYFYPKGSFSLWLNDHHLPFFDVFFKYITHLGDGLVYLILLLIFVAYRYYYAILFVIIAIVQTIPTQILKRFVIEENYRPKLYFESFEHIHLNFIEGVKVNSMNSMPSGHTATAFAIATFLIFISRSARLRYLVLFGAILVALSRVYLLQHFLADVYVGSIIGMFSALIVFFIFDKFYPALKNEARLQRGLLKK